MSKTKSTTKNVSGLYEAVTGGRTYETRISNGRESASGRGGTPAKSQEKAAGRWKGR